MNKTTAAVRRSVGLVAAVFVMGALVGVAVADEPECKCSAAACDVNSPLLTKIPYIGRLFKNVGVVHEQWIGADGECPLACAASKTATCTKCSTECCAATKCSAGKCTSKDACSAKQTTGCCAAGKNECRASGSKCCAADACVTAVKACQCPGKCCGDKCSCPAPDEKVACQVSDCPQCLTAPTKIVRFFAARTQPDANGLWEHIVELAAERAALTAMVEAQEAAHVEQAEFMEQFAELAVENAQLEAAMAMQAERDEMTQKVLEFATENLRLKAQIELAETKAAFAQQIAEARTEAETLKREIARLEWKSSTEDESGVATRPAARKRTR